MTTIIVPTVPKDKQEIKQYLQNASDSLTRIAGERDHIKSIIDECSEKFDVPKKYVRKWIKTHHDQNLELLCQEHDDIVESYKSIMDIE